MLSIEPAKPEDSVAIAHLMEELDRFYGGNEFDPLAQRVGQIEAALFVEPPAAYAILAKQGERLLGLASYSFLWPAVGLTRSIYLKELYVSQEDRRMGVGKLLMDELVKIAARTGCSRVEWTADNDNPLAIGFYDTMQYPRNEGKTSYRVSL